MSWKRGHKTASPTSSLLFGPHRGTRQSTARLVSWGPEITEAGVRSCFGSCCACDEQTRLKGGTNVASELEADPVIRCLWGKQNELLCADQSEPWSDILRGQSRVRTGQSGRSSASPNLVPPGTSPQCCWQVYAWSGNIRETMKTL